MNALEMQNVTKNYAGFSLADVSLSLPKGCILGLVGENGAGKSTLIRLLLGLARPDDGRISVLGQPAGALRDKLGIVFDEPAFSGYMTVDDIEKVMRAVHPAWNGRVFGDHIRRFGLPRGKKFTDFSRGMKMKTMIACALSHDPQLLVLDEPTSGLDPIVRDEILDVFNEFTRNAQNSILISSHIVSDLEKICDYIAFLHHGKLLFCAEKDALKDKYAVVHLTPGDFEAIDPAAVCGKKENRYFTDALVERAKVNPGIAAEPATLEDIILFMAKGAEQ